jgi:hypothetical protein
VSSDLIALVVAIALGLVVVGLGLRRKLGDTTRDWLPQPGEPTSQVTPRPAAAEPRRPLSARGRRWTVRAYLLLGVLYAVLAAQGGDDWAFRAAFAAVWALLALAIWLRKWPPHSTR